MRDWKIVTLVVTLLAGAVVGGGCEPITATALFAGPSDTPAYASTPFPSDIFRQDDGKIGPIDNLSLVGPLKKESLQAQLSELDGFGTRPVVEFFFDAPIDAASVPDTSAADDAAVYVECVDEGSPHFGEMVRFDWRVRDDARSIVGAVRRGVVLEQGTRYAAVLTDKVRAKDGRVGGSDGFSLVKNADPQALPSQYRSTRAALDAIGRSSDVVSLAVFTTAHARDAMYAARAELDVLPAPTVTFHDAELVFTGDDRLRDLLGSPQRDSDGEAKLGWSWGSGLAHDHVAAVGTGLLHAITFRRAEQDCAAGDLPDSGTWAIGDDGAPVVDRAVDLPITFAVPKGPMPERGWPVAFYGHGLGGSRVQMLAFIDTLAREGWATVAIDADNHGSRFSPQDHVNNAGARLGEEFAGVHEMRDGFGDVEGNGTAFAVFHQFVNLSAMRDQMRESVIDLSQVVKALQAGVDLSPLVAGAKVDGDNVVYLGESFGGVLGALFASTEPDVHLFYLDVPGGGVLEYVGPNSPVLSAALRLFVPSTWGIDLEKRTLDRFDPLLGLGATIFDGADPLTYAPHVLRDRPKIGGRELGPRSVILGEVIGDEVLPNSGTNALGRAMGMPIIAPAFDDVEGFEIVNGPLAGNVDGQTAAMVHEAPANHGDNWSDETGAKKFFPFTEDDTAFEALPASIPVRNPIRAIHEQVRRLLRDQRDGNPPTLVVTVHPRHDFDDDGVSDEDEVVAGTDPFKPDAPAP